MSAQTDEYTRTCAWSGEERPGKFYLLTTSEGQELVSEAAFRAGIAPEPLADIEDQEADGGDDGDGTQVEAPAAKVPAPRKAK